MDESEALQLEGSVSQERQLAAEAYEQFGSPGSDDKDVNRSLNVTTLGERVAGRVGRKEPPAGYTAQLVSLTL